MNLSEGSSYMPKTTLAAALTGVLTTRRQSPAIPCTPDGIATTITPSPLIGG